MVSWHFCSPDAWDARAPRRPGEVQALVDALLRPSCDAVAYDQFLGCGGVSRGTAEQGRVRQMSKHNQTAKYFSFLPFRWPHFCMFLHCRVLFLAVPFWRLKAHLLPSAALIFDQHASFHQKIVRHVQLLCPFHYTLFVRYFI